MPNESSEQPNGAYVEITTPKGSRILTGEPANYPTELAAAIKQYAQGDESINALWLQLKQTVKPEDTLPSDESFLLTVDLNGKPDATFERIANAIKTYIAEPMMFKIQFLLVLSLNIQTNNIIQFFSCRHYKYLCIKIQHKKLNKPF